jgi:hypothetical protein
MGLERGCSGINVSQLLHGILPPFLKDPIKAIMNVAIHRDTRVIIKRKCVPY